MVANGKAKWAGVALAVLVTCGGVIAMWGNTRATLAETVRRLDAHGARLDRVEDMLLRGAADLAYIRGRLEALPLALTTP